jgi:hypothetical protein
MLIGMYALFRPYHDKLVEHCFRAEEDGYLENTHYSAVIPPMGLAIGLAVATAFTSVYSPAVCWQLFLMSTGAVAVQALAVAVFLRPINCLRLVYATMRFVAWARASRFAAFLAYLLFLASSAFVAFAAAHGLFGFGLSIALIVLAVATGALVLARRQHRAP